MGMGALCSLDRESDWLIDSIAPPKMVTPCAAEAGPSAYTPALADNNVCQHVPCSIARFVGLYSM